MCHLLHLQIKVIIHRDGSRTFDIGGPWYNFFFFFDIDRGINLKYIKVTYKNKLRAIKKKGKGYFIN
jgi:hypothetical protein